MTIYTTVLKEKLLNERSVLEKELASLAIKNPSNPSDWDAVTSSSDVDIAEEGEVADSMERFENSNSETDQLERQLKDVDNALLKIENDNFGFCEVCEQEIEDDRLEANPSARTCKAHMN